jgi:hypothetical protein
LYDDTFKEKWGHLQGKVTQVAIILYMRTIKFSPRAVAFLDILGFKELVLDAHASASGLKRLSRLIQKLRSNAPLNRVLDPGVPRALHPLSLEISDSIILSTPLRHPDHPTYWGLAILVMRCAQIAALLLEEGYLLNGAINIGSIQHTGRNIVGKAYQDAYANQSAVCSPAIILCPDAAAAWQNSMYRIGQSTLCLRRSVVFKGKDANGRSTLAAREAEIVNVFEPTYMNSVRAIGKKGRAPIMDDAWLSDCIDRIDASISQNLKHFGPGTPAHNDAVLAKWTWLQELFRDQGKPGIEQQFSVHPALIKSTLPGT